MSRTTSYPSIGSLRWRHANTMQGVFPILVTPFDTDERVDEDSLRSVVEFNISAGVHGLGIALGSEILKLTEAERSLVISVVVDHTRGRVPIVVNTGAQANLTAALYSRQAEDLGAAAVMAKRRRPRLLWRRVCP